MPHEPTSTTGRIREVGETRFLNRELSWLDFDERVLALAEDASLPLLERLKFLAIASRNLDEFFQVRVALLHAELQSDVDVVGVDGRTALSLISHGKRMPFGQFLTDGERKEFASVLTDAIQVARAATH